MTSTTENQDPPKEEELVVVATSKESEAKGVAVGGGLVAAKAADTVDYSTISTTEEPSPQNLGGAIYTNNVDDSVVSAITDHASLTGGTMNPPPSNTSLQAASSSPFVAVPSQVILADNNCNAEEAADEGQQIGGTSSELLYTTSVAPSDAPASAAPQAPAPPELQPPLVVTAVPPVPPDSLSIHSASALPDPPPALGATTFEKTSQPRSVFFEPAFITSTPPVAKQNQVSASKVALDDTLDDYIRSPEIQTAIVERSPGGRYVRFTEKLGSGASKDVYRAYDTQEGIEVAWNVVALSGVPKSERNRIVNEVRLLERLHHSNIISFHGSWVNRERQELNFVTEILSAGSLKSFITKVQVIRWKIAKRWAKQILQGLEYLHSQDPPVIHRDLKCDNVFINGTSGDLRIGDLGLSTVHRNGRVLSVLGTPEFMAPDMYEDRSYDEKVDIYAFGMCMLEILTKEIPYAECNNPAQIYKKVSSGEPPEVLSRLQSRHAREFVDLCLGYKDENGNYIRPSASELLKHPFLMKRPNDDDEVVVERPLRERPILEGTGGSNGSSRQGFAQLQHHHSHDTSTAATMAVRPSLKQKTSMASDDDTDHFDEMPESETNMKKVKVLMGRDQVLVEDDENDAPVSKLAPLVVTRVQSSNPAPAPPVQGSPQETVAPTAVPQVDLVREANVAPDVVATSPAAPLPHHHQQTAPVLVQHDMAPPTQLQQQPEPTAHSSSDPTQRHYLVAAAVIEDQGPNIRPYADDILQLVVTLPVEGQTQNVQFAFHLIEDDAVQVAKEMVQELAIPPEAVLEISETISGLACVARQKQEKYSARILQQQKQTPVQQMTEQKQPVQLAGTETAVADDIPSQVRMPAPRVPPVLSDQSANAQHGSNFMISYASAAAENPQNSAYPQVGQVYPLTHQHQGHFMPDAAQQHQHTQPTSGHQGAHVAYHQAPQDLSQQQQGRYVQPSTSGHQGAPVAYHQTPAAQHPTEQGQNFQPAAGQQGAHGTYHQTPASQHPTEQGQNFQPAAGQQGAHGTYHQTPATQYPTEQGQNFQPAAGQQGAHGTYHQTPATQQGHYGQSLATQQEGIVQQGTVTFFHQATAPQQQQGHHGQSQATQQDGSAAPGQQGMVAAYHQAMASQQQQGHHGQSQDDFRSSSQGFAPHASFSQQQLQQGSVSPEAVLQPHQLGQQQGAQPICVNASPETMPLNSQHIQPPATHQAVPAHGLVAPETVPHRHQTGQLGSPSQGTQSSNQHFTPAHPVQQGHSQLRQGQQMPPASSGLQGVPVLEQRASVSAPPVHQDAATQMQVQNQLPSHANTVSAVPLAPSQTLQQPVETTRPMPPPVGQQPHPSCPVPISLVPTGVPSQKTSSMSSSDYTLSENTFQGTDIEGLNAEQREVMRRLEEDYQKQHIFSEEEELDDEKRELMRRLEEDYQKQIKIVKKVFDSRMENLARSQTEKEAQHQRTLEKHEQERAAFERRRAQEEEQQMKRIEQLQKDWESKREQLARQMSTPASSAHADQRPPGTPFSNDSGPMPVNGSQDHTHEHRPSTATPLQNMPTIVPLASASQTAQRNVSPASTVSVTPSVGTADQSQQTQP